MTEVWQPIRLADVALIKHGFPFKTDYCREEQTRYLLLSPGNVSIGGGFQLGKARYYDGPIPDGYVLSAGTLFVTMTDLSRDADTLGYPAVLPDSAEVEFLHNQRLGKIEITKPECIDKWFLYYLLRTSEYRDEVLASASGSTVKHTAPKRILAFTTEIPGLNEQKRIAALLRVLDDKIELNQRMNKTLEEMAQALFKSWFVDFDPVQAKAAGSKPFGMDDAAAALFPSHFEESELGSIPRGWCVGMIGDVGLNTKSQCKPSDIPPETPYIGLEHMPQRSTILSEWGVALNVTSNKFRFKKGQILFGKLRPYFHKVGVAGMDGVCSTDILVLNAKEPGWFGFLLGHVSSAALIDYVDAASSGTRMPRTDWKTISRYQVILPPLSVASAYLECVSPLLAMALQNVAESRTLAALRDLLLPKLLSGEIRLRDADRQVEAAL